MKLCLVVVLIAACGGTSNPPPKPVEPAKPTLILVNVDDEGLALQGWDPGRSGLSSWKQDPRGVQGEAE